jgi:hypothetical protein
MLRLSRNRGRSFEPGYLVRFPSDIQSISAGGAVLDTVWVCTAGGGIYISFRPGIWNTLTPEETGIRFNHLTPATETGRNLLATGGASVTAMMLASVGIRCEQNTDGPGPESVRLYMTMNNPSVRQEADFHLIGLPTGDRTVFYRFDGGAPEPVSQPSPLPLTLKSHTRYPEVFIGAIEVSADHRPFLLVAGLFRRNTWDPIAELAAAEIPPVR